MHKFSNKLSEISTYDDFFAYANLLSEKEKGDIFEYLTKLILTTKPEYSSILKTVWLQQDGMPKEIREHLNLPTTDEGIDLVAETFTGEYWAIQCKFKGQNQTPTYKELSTFGNLANNYCKNISLALLVHTGEKGVLKKRLLGKNYTEIGLEFWLGLKQEDWDRINKKLKGQSIRPIPKIPRPHQQNALLNATIHYVKNNASRGRLIMPCGTGKSLTAFWIAHALDAKTIIVAVPSLALIKQSLEDWTRELIAHNEEPRPEWLVICSDESTGNLDKDEFVSDTYSLGIPTTTNVDVIGNFLSNGYDGRKIVFTTYHSSDRLAQAARKCNVSFDLAILDEAHKTVGVKSKSFATLLSDKNISISQRMFMTATERVIRGNNDDVYSMDDKHIYGDLFYRLSVKDAIHSEPPIISDYKILTITVTNDEIKDLITRNKLLTDKGEKLEEQEAQSLAAAIALRKATQSYGIKHAISFHRSIKGADDFAKLNKTLNAGNISDILLSSSHISSKKSAGERARLLNDFAHEQLALMTNARCLTEGVDVPAIDCVLFADPKQSTIDIVQAAGRALRPFSGKEFGYIMLPIIVPDNLTFDEFTETTPFKQVARVISALSTQDEGIAIEFRINSSVKQDGEKKIIFEGSVPVGLKMDLNSFAEKINAKIWERVAKVNWKSFEDARLFVHQLGFKSGKGWTDYCLSGKKPHDIPAFPQETYFNKGWKNWGDWLGTGTIATGLREYRSYSDARAFVHELGFKSSKGWTDYCKSGKKPDDIPAHPQRTYSGIGWKRMGDWLGTGTFASWLREYRSFSEARAFVHELGFKSIKGWKDYCQSGKKPDDIPNAPHLTYKDKGWKNWGDWLGNDTIATGLRKYRSFNEARAFVHELEFKSLKGWKEYCQSGKKPDDIPTKPDNTYKDKGWMGMGDWLGTGTIASWLREYRSFNEARAFVHELGLKSGKGWKDYCESGKKPDDIPNTPHVVYEDKGWKGMGDWLGTGTVATRLKEYRSFSKARAFVHELRLSGKKEWKEYSQSGKKPNDISNNPDITYKNKGWKNWGDWLDTGVVATRLKEYRLFSEARAFVHELGLKSGEQWKEYCKSGKKPDDIPNVPNVTYKAEGWKGMGDWLGTGKIANQFREYRSFNESRAFVHVLGLKSGMEWTTYCKSGKKPDDIPTKPYDIYKDIGWFGMCDWLGAELRKFRSFDEARAFVHELGCKGVEGWKDYCQSGKKPDDIPANPNFTYKDKGWVGITDWLGTELRYYRSFSEAKVFVHVLGLNNSKEWTAYCKSGKKPDDIPTKPNDIYKDKGWVGMGDWLGTGNISNRLREHRTFSEAKAFVHELGFKNRNEWTDYCKSGKKPDDIPAKPNDTYKGKGWVGMGDWLGTGNISNRLREYRSFSEARAFVHELGFKIGEEWKDYCKSGKKPDDIPAKPDNTYKNKGWKGMGDWLGTTTSS